MNSTERLEKVMDLQKEMQRKARLVDHLIGREANRFRTGKSSNSTDNKLINDLLREIEDLAAELEKLAVDIA